MAPGAEVLAAAIAAWGDARQPAGSLVVALDGHGGAGKSTIADELQQLLDLVVVHTDDFFRPPEQQAEADAATVDQQPMARYYDWNLLRGVLIPLSASAVVVLEGVSSAAPALADLVDRAVLVQTPQPERLTRLRARIPADEWDEAWLAAELTYFASLPADRFDLTVSGSAP